MFLLRSVFWFGLVALLVPYKSLDPAHGTFVIDSDALIERLSALPHYCTENERACAAAGDLASLLQSKSVEVAQGIASRLPSHG